MSDNRRIDKIRKMNDEDFLNWLVRHDEISKEKGFLSKEGLTEYQENEFDNQPVEVKKTHS